MIESKKESRGREEMKTNKVKRKDSEKEMEKLNAELDKKIKRSFVKFEKFQKNRY